MESLVKITPDSIDSDRLLAYLTESEGGAIDIFLGTTRRFTAGRETVSLSYEAAPNLAEKEIQKILSDAARKWPLIRAAIVHRTGLVPVNEASVFIGVATEHRSEAFSACRFLIDELKKRVPIWKREKFCDGSEEWVQGVTPSGD
ncbi:MAG: molybdenum cofactor biosynthesis protein MoaE [Bacteroidetes bacterium]|nr:MAG: molybdenum cofactor biosynthesis protein MoaE [Bacteroidota bacterium]